MRNILKRMQNLFSDFHFLRYFVHTCTFCTQDTLVCTKVLPGGSRTKPGGPPQDALIATSGGVSLGFSFLVRLKGI